MDSQRIRVEIIRFALLLIVTVGLISVAQRAFDDDKQVTGAHGRPSTSASPAPGSAGSRPATAPSSSPPATTPPAAGSGNDGNAGATTGADGSDANGSGGSSRGGETNAAGQPILPRTGPDGAVRLAGLALVLIAAGSLSVVGTRRSA